MVYIFEALRTPIGDLGGSLKDHSAVDLGKLLIESVMDRTGIDRDKIDGVIMGNVLQAGSGQNPARQCGLGAGLGNSISAFTVNKVCGSGMKAIDLAIGDMTLKERSLYIAGGIESMSNAPYLLEDTRWGYKLGDRKVIDSIVKDGLSCPYNRKHMAILTEELRDEYDIDRRSQDEFSLESHSKALDAIKKSRFSDEIVPVEVVSRKEKTVFAKDEHPRADTNMDRLSKLRPIFSKNGTITAGNASSINDGAAIISLASRDCMDKNDLSPLAEIIAVSEVGVDPKYFGIAPIQAIREVLDKAALSLEDIGLFEINEAFAAQMLAVLKELRIDRDRLNVNGGAIALGHPIGASGARIVVTLLHEMIKRNTEYGLASLCIGSGEAMAIILRRID